MDDKSELDARCVEAVDARAVDWVWPGRIPAGKLTLVSGDPGGGKTLLALHVAAVVSRGGTWPDSTAAPAGETLIATAEDDVPDTIRPRLEAAGGDLGQIYELRGLARRGGRGAWNLANVDAIARFCDKRQNMKLLILDPVSAFLGGADGGRNGPVRELLTPLSALAADRGIAVLCLTHLRKSEGPAAYRSIDSIAFLAAARAAWSVARDKTDPERRLFLPVKANLSRAIKGLSYRVGTAEVEISGQMVPQPILEWEPGEVEVSADDAAGDAAAFLSEHLAAGPVDGNDLRARAREAGVAWSEVEHARKKLRVQLRPGGFQGRWLWHLPPAPRPSILQ